MPRKSVLDKLGYQQAKKKAEEQADKSLKEKEKKGKEEEKKGEKKELGGLSEELKSLSLKELKKEKEKVGLAAATSSFFNKSSPNTPKTSLDGVMRPVPIESVIAHLVENGFISPERKKDAVQALIASDHTLVQEQPASVSSSSSLSAKGRNYDSSESQEHSRGVATSIASKSQGRNRPVTAMGAQGEHVSAYSLYVELVLSILESTNAKHFSKNLIPGLKCIGIGEFLDEKKEKKEKQGKGEKLQGLIEELQAVKEENISKDERQYIINIFERHLKNCQEDDTEREKCEKVLDRNINAIRHSNRANLVAVIEKIILVVLENTNIMRYVSFPRQGGEETPSRGERTAKNDLRVLNDFLLELAGRFDEARAVLEQHASSLSHREIKGGFGYAGYSFAVIDKKSSGKLSKEEEKSEESECKKISKEVITEIISDEQKFINQIADKMNLLFWYPMIPEEKLIKPENWKEKAKQYNYSKNAQFRTNKLEILYQVAARHIVLIFNCYKGLVYLPENIQEEIVDQFLGYILAVNENKNRGQGWSNHSDWLEEEEIEKKQKLKDGIERFANLNYIEGKFAMKDELSQDDTDEEDDFLSEESNLGGPSGNF